MKTATIPDCKTLLQLAADHPEKLEAINEFIKNIIILVDLTGKAETKKNHGFTVTTKKVYNLRSAKTGEATHDYFISITDGKHTARFMNNGENVLTLADFASGENSNGLRFYGYRSDPGHIHKYDRWEKGQKRNIEMCDMQNFINECLNVPINFAHGGEMIYPF